MTFPPDLILIYKYALCWKAISYARLPSMYNSAFCVFKIMLFSGLVYVYQVSWQTQKALGRFKILRNISQGNRSRRGIHIWHLQRTCLGVPSTCSFIAGDLGQEPLEEHSSQSLESCHVLENETVLSLLVPDSPVLQTDL